MAALIRGENGMPTVLARAIVAVQNEKPIMDVGDGADALASVRMLSRAAERQDTISDLLSLAEPLLPEQEELPATFGVRPEDFPKPPNP